MRELIYRYQTAITQQEQDKIIAELKARPFWGKGKSIHKRKYYETVQTQKTKRILQTPSLV